MNGYSFKCEHFFYTFLKKHYCPNCGNKLLRKKVSVVINSESPEAKNYDFNSALTHHQRRKCHKMRGNTVLSVLPLFCP